MTSQTPALSSVMLFPLQQADFQHLQGLVNANSFSDCHLKARAEVAKMAFILFRDLLLQTWQSVKTLAIAVFQIPSGAFRPHFEISLNHMYRARCDLAGLLTTLAAVVQPSKALSYYEWANVVAPPALPEPEVTGWRAIALSIQKSVAAAWSSPCRNAVLIGAATVATIIGLGIAYRYRLAPTEPQILKDNQGSEPTFWSRYGKALGGLGLLAGAGAVWCISRKRGMPKGGIQGMPKGSFGESHLKSLEKRGALIKQMGSPAIYRNEAFMKKVVEYMKEELADHELLYQELEARSTKKGQVDYVGVFLNLAQQRALPGNRYIYCFAYFHLPEMYLLVRNCTYFQNGYQYQGVTKELCQLFYTSGTSHYECRQLYNQFCRLFSNLENKVLQQGVKINHQEIGDRLMDERFSKWSQPDPDRPLSDFTDSAGIGSDEEPEADVDNSKFALRYPGTTPTGSWLVK